jgi:hypothetical protein
VEKVEPAYHDIWHDKKALIAEKKLLEMKKAEAVEHHDHKRMVNLIGTIKKITERIDALP